MWKIDFSIFYKQALYLRINYVFSPYKYTNLYFSVPMNINQLVGILHLTYRVGIQIPYSRDTPLVYMIKDLNSEFPIYSSSGVNI